MHGFRRTQQEVVTVVKICDHTLRKRSACSARSLGLLSLPYGHKARICHCHHGVACTRLRDFGDTRSAQLTPEEFETIELEQVTTRLISSSSLTRSPSTRARLVHFMRPQAENPPAFKRLQRLEAMRRQQEAHCMRIRMIEVTTRGALREYLRWATRMSVCVCMCAAPFSSPPLCRCRCFAPQDDDTVPDSLEALDDQLDGTTATMRRERLARRHAKDVTTPAAPSTSPPIPSPATGGIAPATTEVTPPLSLPTRPDAENGACGAPRPGFRILLDDDGDDSGDRGNGDRERHNISQTRRPSRAVQMGSQRAGQKRALPAAVVDDDGDGDDSPEMADASKRGGDSSGDEAEDAKIAHEREARAASGMLRLGALGAPSPATSPSRAAASPPAEPAPQAPPPAAKLEAGAPEVPPTAKREAGAPAAVGTPVGDMGDAELAAFAERVGTSGLGALGMPADDEEAPRTAVESASAPSITW